MICYASAYYQALYLQFPEEDTCQIKRIYSALGPQLIDFLYFDLAEVDDMFRNLCNYVLLSDENEMDDDKLLCYIHEIDQSSIYLHFYTQALLKFTEQYITYGVEAFDDLFTFASDVSEKDFKKFRVFNTEDEFKKLSNILDARDCAKAIIIKDIEIKRLKLQHEMEYIATFGKDIKEEHMLQRIYILDLKHRERGEELYYINHTFHSELVPVDLSIFEETQQENIKVFELYEINSVDEYIRFELFNSVKNDIIIKKCQNCGQYFIPFGRSDTEYCDRQVPGSKKSCNQIGPMQKYKAKISGNEIYSAYNKAYRRNNSRVRNKKMSQPEFYTWSEEARNKRDECYNGTITLEEFQQWLNFR